MSTPLQTANRATNHLDRALTWNPGGVLAGAKHITLAGAIAYISGDFGVAIVNLDTPLEPKLITVIPFDGARSTALQFRYLYVTDRAGFHVVDVTDPTTPRIIESASIPMARSSSYLCRKNLRLRSGWT